jgi:hypothetical protein
MKEEYLMKKHRIHNAIYKSGNKHEEQKTITREFDNEDQQFRLRLRAFV